jgi:hypothetical protein
MVSLAGVVLVMLRALSELARGVWCLDVHA